MLDFSRELSETMAAGQAAGMPGTHIIHFSDFQGIVFTRTDTSYLPPEGAWRETFAYTSPINRPITSL